MDTQGSSSKSSSRRDVQDRMGAIVAHALRLYGPELPRLQRIWADAAYGGALIDELREQMRWRLAIVKRSATSTEDHFCCPTASLDRRADVRLVGRFPAASCDYEFQVESREALIYAGMSQFMLRRLAELPTPSCRLDNFQNTLLDSLTVIQYRVEQGPIYAGIGQLQRLPRTATLRRETMCTKLT